MTPKKKRSPAPAKSKARLLKLQRDAARADLIEVLQGARKRSATHTIQGLLVVLGDAVPGDARRVVSAVLKAVRENDLGALAGTVGSKSVTEWARLYLHGTRGSLPKQRYVQHVAEYWSTWPEQWRVTYAVQGVRAVRKSDVPIADLEARLRKKLATHPNLDGLDVAEFLLRAAGHSNPLAWMRKQERKG